MLERYTVHYLGPRTTITSTADGPWPRWEMARAAAIEHLEDVAVGRKASRRRKLIAREDPVDYGAQQRLFMWGEHLVSL